MDKTLIEFKNVTKFFKINSDKFLRSFILGKQKTTASIYGARNLNFYVKKGEVLGLFGPNGSGKSTVLRLAARILHPDSGEVNVYGSVANVIELGAGLHHELSGEENIDLYATILGIDKAKINEKRKSIISFAGIEKFIKTPVKFYSSGMRARLATAIALYSDADILLLDEAISVGDTDFREKFLRFIEKNKKNKAVIFSTHDMSMLIHLSDKIILLDHGVAQNRDNEIAIWKAQSLKIGKKFKGVIESNSMYPLLKKGDKVVINKTNFSDVKEGEVIAFVPPKLPLVIVHRVSEIHKNGKDSYLITKGDSSVGFDVWKVTKEDYLGKIDLKASKLKNRS